MCEICGGKNYIAVILVAKECFGNMSRVLARFIFFLKIGSNAGLNLLSYFGQSGKSVEVCQWSVLCQIVCKGFLVFSNPLYPRIGFHNLRTVLFKSSYVRTRRICLTTRNFFLNSHELYF